MPDTTHIFDVHVSEITSITTMIGRIGQKLCDYNYKDTDGPCNLPATHWAVCAKGIIGACRNHGILGSSQGNSHIEATIDADGLHVSDGDSIDRILFCACDYCGEPFLPEELMPGNNDSDICEDCLESEAACK